uniref:arginine kinase n=1 Tax=Meloidogyne hapla TaxID=6305 RepID=A0A1I8BLE9_MELHA
MAQFLKKNKGPLIVAGIAGAGIGYWTWTSLYPTARECLYSFFNINEADGYTVKRIEDAYRKLQESEECHSLLKKHFTESVKDKLKYKKTKLGGTLFDVIRSGVANLDSGVGVYAPDAESYTKFAALFDPIIDDYHGGFGPNAKHPATDFGENKVSELKDLDPEGKYILSTRIRCGRSFKGYPFNPLLTRSDYLTMESKVKNTFLVWVNEEDHLRIISMQNGGNVGQVLERLIKGVKAIENKVPFSRDDRLGYLTFCPSNLGTTVRASVHIKLPKISSKPEFKKLCEEMKLQIRGIHGEHSETEGGVYDVSNKARLGLTEYEAVKQMYDGVKKLIELEKAAS